MVRQPFAGYRVLFAMRILRGVLILIGVIAVAGSAFAAVVIVTGGYDVAADSGRGLLDRIAVYVRERSIAARDADIAVPPLDSPFVIAAGAAEYDKMCTACHLAPGMKDNDMRAGMNPRPPRLAARQYPAAHEDFWVIKHGVKMTAMPAWGETHSDRDLWDIVAFLQKLPGMTAPQYRALVAAGTAPAQTVGANVPPTSPPAGPLQPGAKAPHDRP